MPYKLDGMDPAFHRHVQQALFDQVVAQLRAVRERKGLSGHDLDERIGVAEGQVSKWECGTRRPTAFLLEAWVLALGCDIQVIDRDTNPATTVDA